MSQDSAQKNKGREENGGENAAAARTRAEELCFPFHYIDGHAPSASTSPSPDAVCTHAPDASASPTSRLSHVRLCASPAQPPAPSLTGREHQRFGADGFRLLGGCVPYRVDRVTGPDGEESTEMHVLLVNAQKRGDFIFPKGGWEKFESAPCCAQRECLEEGGVEGDVIAQLPSVDFASKRGKRSRLHPFLLRVRTQHESWAERDTRRRKWVPLQEVAAQMQRDETKQVWQSALQALRKAGFLDQHGKPVFKPIDSDTGNEKQTAEEETHT